MNKWKLMTGVTLVFLVGALAGSLGTGFYLKHRFEPLLKSDRDRRAFGMDRLARRLDLTPAQEQKVEAIILRMRRAHREHFKQRRAELRKYRDLSVAELKTVLNPEQRKRLDRMIQRHEERRKHRRMNHPRE
jgi:Spy/CpxP family protein refolding chaperone